MNNISHQVTFASQIISDQLPSLVEQGFKTVICNRPDGESTDQPQANTIEQACVAEGLVFKHIPFSGGMLTREDIEEFANFFNNAEQPVYMYCRSGKRSSMLYQAAVQMELLD